MIKSMDYLFWKFIEKHKNKFKKIGRMANLIKYTKKQIIELRK